MKNKKKWIMLGIGVVAGIVLAVIIIIAGLISLRVHMSGSKSYTEDYYNKSNGMAFDIDSIAGNSFSSGDVYFDEDYDYSYSESSSDSYPSSTPAEPSETTSTGVIDTDKLVYHGSVTVSTEDFDTTVENFKVLMQNYNAFIEDESVSDDGYSYSYYIDERSRTKRMRYNATVRVPSKDFQAFVNGINGVGGDVVASNQYVENIFQRYSTAQTNLEIYQIKYNRYKELLSQAYDMQDMLYIENELTDLEIKLANYKTQLSNMDTDLAYSYVDITIRKVEWYEHEDESSFITRLMNTWKDSLKGFLNFCEWLIGFIVMYFWYIIPFTIGVVVIVKRHRKHKKQKSVDLNNKTED